jgi:CheY-like chemotaxis protein
MHNIKNAQELFAEELHKSLRNLYDPAILVRGKLPPLFAIQDSANSGATLRRILIDSIQSLKPDASVPLHTQTWRVYQILTYRFIEQVSQKEVADDLNLSIRQLRRLEKIAVQSLAYYLWVKYDLGKKWESSLPLLSEETTGPIVESLPNSVLELERLKQSFVSEVSDLKMIMDTSMKTVRPLLTSIGMEIEDQIPSDLPKITVKLPPFRQALFNLLSLVSRNISGGRLYLQAKSGEGTIQLQLTVRLGRKISQDMVSKEELDITCQLVKIAGGEFLSLKEEPNGVLTAIIRLPVVEQVPVLVIDDNIDTLHLVERFLTATRFRYLGSSNPEQALAIARGTPPRVILLDVMLPGIDGWELLGRLREHPITRSIPIIVCTFLPQEELALSLGAAEFIRKPVSQQKLLSALDHLIDRPSIELH